jgi:hypothetical protein
MKRLEQDRRICQHNNTYQDSWSALETPNLKLLTEKEKKRKKQRFTGKVLLARVDKETFQKTVEMCNYINLTETTLLYCRRF